MGVMALNITKDILVLNMQKEKSGWVVKRRKRLGTPKVRDDIGKNCEVFVNRFGSELTCVDCSIPSSSRGAEKFN